MFFTANLDAALLQRFVRVDTQKSQRKKAKPYQVSKLTENLKNKFTTEG
jgi:hypothetical protein